MTDETLTTLVAIVVIGGLEALALYTGIDGSLFGLVVAAISGLGGYKLRQRKEKVAKKLTEE